MGKENNTGKLLRLPQVLERIPVSKSTWWDGVKQGHYPQPIKLGARITCWKLKDIEQIAEFGVQL